MKYDMVGFWLATQACSWLGHIRNYALGAECATYRTATHEEEEQYWRASERLSRAFRASDGNRTPENIPLVRYFTPKLLPMYREKEEDDPEAAEFYLHPKAYCKWHRMVFPGPVSATQVMVAGWMLMNCGEDASYDPGGPRADQVLQQS